jgi:hypothetical protein
MSNLIRPLPLYHRGMSPDYGWPPKKRPLQMGARDFSRQMEQGDRTYSFDANMGLSDASLAYTASGYSQYQGADGIIDLGGNQNVTINLPSIADVATYKPQQARIDAVCVIDLTAIKTSAGNELYKLILLGSNDSSFGAGNVQMLSMIEFGAAASIDGPAGASFVTPAPPSVGGSRYELFFSAEQNNVKYEWLKLYNLISGTLPSITYRAFGAVLPEP